VDVHTHLDYPEFDADRDEVLARASAAGVGAVFVCGSDPARWTFASTLPVTLFLGIHPWVAAGLSDDEHRSLLADLAARPCAGIGEIGLDRLHGRSPEAWSRQLRSLRDQLALARERNVPVQFHGVRSWPELLTVLQRDGVPDAGGIAHAWSAAPDQVDRAVRLGLMLSFGPMVLFDRARKARQSAAQVPLGHLLIETDCPHMLAPGVKRGEPAHLPLVLHGLAALRETREDLLSAHMLENVRQLFPRLLHVS
jgi:TatD DNase family protein